MIASELWKEIQKKVLEPERKSGVRLWWVRIVAGRFSIPGLPDVWICYEGLFMVWELKRDTEDKLRPKQKWIMDKIRAAGGITGTVRTVGDARALLARAHTLALR